MLRKRLQRHCRQLSRIQLNFVPEWEGAVQGWVVNYIKKNVWRVEPELDFDDLLQEAYLKYHKMTQYYPEVVEVRHFMSLFQISFINHLHRLSNKRTRKGMYVSEYFTPNGDPVQAVDMQEAEPVDLYEAELRMLLEDAPKPLAILAVRMLNSETRPVHRRSVGGRRETTENYLCRLAGCTKTFKIVDAIKNWLKVENESIPTH